jgi:hypothetical protein
MVSSGIIRSGFGIGTARITHQLMPYQQSSTISDDICSDQTYLLSREMSIKKRNLKREKSDGLVTS